MRPAGSASPAASATVASTLLRGELRPNTLVEPVQHGSAWNRATTPLLRGDGVVPRPGSHGCAQILAVMPDSQLGGRYDAELALPVSN